MEHLAEKLRELRKKKGLSQEEAAAYLQISFQSVSKWERGISYPDVQMIVRIARFYGISTDELLGVHEQQEEQEIEAVLQQWERDNGKGENYQNVELMRNALKRFPGKYELMVKLVTSLEKCQGTREEVDSFRREAIEISERIIQQCPDARIRNDMLYNICYSYWNIGEKELAVERAKQLPGLIKTRENALVTFFEEEDSVLVAQEAIVTLTRLLYHHMSGLFRGGLYSTEQKMDLFQRYLEICDMLFEKQDVQEVIHCKIGVHMKMAQFCQTSGNIPEMIKNICSIEGLLKDSQNCEKKAESESILSNRIHYKSMINVEYKKNWVVEQLEQYFLPKGNPEIEAIYKRIREME